MEDSEKYTLSNTDLKKVGIGFLIAMGGAGLTYLTELIPNVDFGELTPLVVGLFSVFVNFARKFLTDLKPLNP